MSWTRRQRIEFLLENYLDVEYGLQEPISGPGDFIPQMCRAYRHPSYVELRRVLAALQMTEPELWWNLSENYFHYQERRVLVCPRCQKQYPPDLDGIIHKHGSSTFAVVPRIVRSVSQAIRPELLQAAVAWIDQAFQGEPFIPDDLLAYAAA